MKACGALLILVGSLWGYLQYRRQMLLPLRLARALMNDLAVLRYEICISRRPIPVIMERDLNTGLGAEYLWRPFGSLLEENRGKMTLQECWTQALAPLPDELSICMSPLGSLLGNGGESLAHAVDEVRKELELRIRAREARLTGQMKLSAALSISGACLVILILL